MMNLEGRVAVVTGASSGLGRRMAVELAKEGAIVVAIARRKDRLDELAEELQSFSLPSDIAPCDISDTDSYVALLNDIERTHGRIDALVNNAGIGEVEGDGVEPHRIVMDTNYFAAVAGTLAVLPGMKARRDGDIVNVSSDAGRAPLPREPAYSASKAAISAFTEAMSYVTEPDGVRMHVLYPGWVPTEMTTEADGSSSEQLPPKVVRRTDEQIARLLIDGLGTKQLILDATVVARMAPVAKALFPEAYRRGVTRFS
jgi:short-subunit dehydrogenase